MADINMGIDVLMQDKVTLAKGCYQLLRIGRFSLSTDKGKTICHGNRRPTIVKGKMSPVQNQIFP